MKCYIIRFLQKLVKMLNFIFYHNENVLKKVKKYQVPRKTVINVTTNQVILESFYRLPFEDTLKGYSSGFMVMALNMT